MLFSAECTQIAGGLILNFSNGTNQVPEAPQGLPEAGSFWFLAGSLADKCGSFWFHVDFPRFHGSNNAVCTTHFYSDAVVAFGKALGFQTDFVFFPFIFGFGAIYHAGKNFSRVGGSLEQNFRGITGIYFDAGVGRADNQGDRRFEIFVCYLC